MKPIKLATWDPRVSALGWDLNLLIASGGSVNANSCLRFMAQASELMFSSGAS